MTWREARTKARRYKLTQYGLVYPARTVKAAAEARLPLADACALLEKESFKGKNVFGSDPVSNPVKGGTVTRGRYRTYKRHRKAGRGMQGVGPTQLTWYTYQDDADRLGGCWRPYINMKVGFGILKKVGPKAYNGSGPAAEAYERDYYEKRHHWRRRFKGL